MSIITFDIASFRLSFPAFANITTYPDALLQRNWDHATCYVSDCNYGYLRGDCRERGIQLMTAHLTYLESAINSGNAPQLVSSSTVDNVSVTLVPPPTPTMFQWWLALTPYGQQLLALLSAFAVMGTFVGGSNNRNAFRKPDGRF